VQPDFIVCRSDHAIEDGVREKIALFCDVDADDVLACPDAPSIYEVPLSLYEQGFDISAMAKMGLAPRKIKLAPWRAFLKAKDACAGELDIAVVGKYVSLPDAYLSVHEALEHAGIACGHRHLGIHGFKQRAFATAHTPYEIYKFARFDFEVDVLEHHKFFACYIDIFILYNDRHKKLYSSD